MGKVRYVDFAPDEFLIGVAGMDADAIGVYWTICALIYSTGGAIPVDDARLRAIAKCHGRRFKVIIEQLVAGDKLVVKDGQMVNKRSVSELQKADNRITSAVQNGRKGGRPRKKINDIEKAAGSETEKLTTNNQQPTTNNIRESSSTPTTESSPARMVDGGGPGVNEIDRRAMDIAEQIRETLGVTGNPAWASAWGVVRGWLAEGADLDRDIIPWVVKAQELRTQVQSINYFTPMVRRSVEERKHVRSDVASRPVAEPRGYDAVIAGARAALNRKQ